MTENNPATDASAFEPEPHWPEPDWEEIEKFYQTDDRLQIIADKYGLNVQKIIAHARNAGWPLRTSRKKKTRAKSKSKAKNIAKRTAKQIPAPKKKQVQRQQGPASLRRRLTGLVERQIAEIETRLADSAEARDHERDARTLSNLTRTLDKLVELKRNAEEETAARRQRARLARTQERGEADAEAIRTDLARRLARLVAANEPT